MKQALFFPISNLRVLVDIRIILLISCLLPTAAKATTSKNINQLLPESQVWVINPNRSTQPQPYRWVVESGQRNSKPKLQVGKPTIPIVANKQQSSSFEQLTQGSEKVDGLFTLYRTGAGKIYLEVKPEQLNKNYLGTITMESGVGERGIYSGLPLQDMLFYFRRVNNNLHFVVRNVNFRTEPGDPQERSLNRSFSDSVLYSLPIRSINPTQKSILIDLSDLMLTDLPGLTSMLSGSIGGKYEIDSSKSYFGTAKAFPSNIEVESIYGFSRVSDDGDNLSALPDARALNLHIRYSFSELPQNNGFRPRLADERVGYFFTAYQDLTNNNRRDSFVRYINRWNLEKQEPNAALSPPKKQIVFWIENAVPVEYREAIQEGVLMWNQAFEQAGFKDAIAVRQMPDNADWDSADVRYNTIRWFNSVDSNFSAIGPSRVNPLTGEILDADILVDASFIRTSQQTYRNFVEQNRAQSNSLSSLISSRRLCQSGLNSSFLARLAQEHDLCYGRESTRASAIAQTSLSLLQNVAPGSPQMKEYVRQNLRSLIAHEVGHTLGLRHNFRGSTLLTPSELDNPEVTQTKGLVNSVMDYFPANIAAPGMPQSDYFPHAVGAYDRWAIEFGYKLSDAGTIDERRFLEDIAKRSANPELAYATDEDSVDLDPFTNRWDLSSDVLGYSKTQLDRARVMWERLETRTPEAGQSYSEMSELFDSVFWNYFQNTYYVTKYIGGQSFYRDRAGEPNARLPFAPVPVEKQREALLVLQKYVFAQDAFTFSPQLLNKLAPSRWMDWGNVARVERLDYPIHDSIFFLQSQVLRELLSSDRLTRLRDLELKTSEGQALTLPELFETLEKSIWTEVIQPDKSVNISSFRRSLQRDYLEILSNMVLRRSDVPEDARTIAWYRLRQLQGSIDRALSHNGDKMDTYTKAHLEETRDRINKTLDAQIQSR